MKGKIHAMARASKKHNTTEYYLRRDDGLWLLHNIIGMDVIVTLMGLGCTLTMAGIYAQVAFED